MAAFIGSCNATRQLSEQLLRKEHQEYPPPSVDSSFCVPGEQPARDLLQKLIPGHAPDPNIDDQHHLQALLDSDLCSSLKDDSSLRDRARINTISAQHAGAWLSALPNPNLGLAMPSKEFIVAVWLRLGLTFFPGSPQSILCPGSPQSILCPGSP